MKSLFPFTLLIIFTSCTYNDITKPVVLLSGTYKGNFSRSSPLVKYASAEVTISFDDNSFEGTSNMIKYPAICRGTFSLSGNQIEFTNICAWTAEFDWSLILSGKYTFSINGDEIQFKRSYDEFNHDFYWLKKQP
jgi:hypothetical protein